jgi:branched-subunit amino acid aminotransferase/4-amino-4-deoxychorismate lyase
MATYLLKKSYQLKDLKQIEFQDLWGDHGIFTTMWIFGKPPKILFFENHIKNLIRSLRIYGVKKKNLRRNIQKIINQNLSKKIKYNHLLRVALNKKLFPYP